MANPTERYRAMRSGLTLGGRVFREGETFGYTDLAMRNRDKNWEMLAESDKFEKVTDDEMEAEVVANTTSNSPSQPQGGPDAPLAGDSPEAKAAKQFKNMETAGVVSQAAGLQGNTGADVEAMAAKAEAELEFRGEANPAAAVDESAAPEKVSAEPVAEQPSASRRAKASEKDAAKEDEK